MMIQFAIGRTVLSCWREFTVDHLRVLLAITACAMFASLSGCMTYFKPYVDVYPAGTSPLASPALPRVTETLSSIDGWINATAEKRSDSSTSQRVLNVATFGLAAGAVVAPVYNAYKDLATALAMGAGTAYTANSLFFGGGQIDVYAAGLVSLACVQHRGGAMIGAMGPENSAELQQDFKRIEPQAQVCLKPEDLARLRATYNGAADSLQRIVGSDPSASIKLYQAAQNVVLAMNAEIDKRAPSPAAVFAAAKSLTGLSVGKATTPTTPPKTEDAQGCEGAAQIAYLLDKISYYEQRRRTADAALNGVSELDTACVFGAPAVADFAVNQDAITVVADAKTNIAVSGGRAPYVASWDKDPTSSGVLLSQPVPDTFTVQGTSAPKDGSFKLTIRDSSAARSSKVVTVTSKAKS